MSERWLIIRNGAVGDTVLLSSVICAIKKQHPDAWIEVMGVLERVALLVGDGLADCAVSAERPGVESLYGEGALHSDLFDYFAEFSHILIYSAAASQQFVNRLKVRNGQWVCAYPALPQDNEQHITDFYLNPLRKMLGDETPQPVIHLYEEEKANAREELSKLSVQKGRRLIGVHPGAGGPAKQALPEKFLQEVDTIQGDKCLLIVKGPADEDAVAALVERLPNGMEHHLLDQRPLRELAALLSQCDQFIGNDSGVTHIAAALGVPTSVFFLASDPAVWAPPGEHVQVMKISD
ncbi:MAG: glycosyltransferase family 9 protein [Candidatus Hinthialibacter antarcticus]|nr:glycosyltransferase family 9 protein [Candidatus Hinthialibacter antarcticus]